MGKYINPGPATFQEAINSKVFVDKTNIVNELNSIVHTLQKFVCVTRPRRFGKTIAQELLCAYFSKGFDSRKMLECLKLSKTEGWDKFLNKFNVLRIDCNDFSENVGKEGEHSFVNEMTSRIKQDFIDVFPNIDFSRQKRIADCIYKVFAETGISFVVLFDEYDLEIRMSQKENLHWEYVELLVSLFKNETINPAIALAYMTGIVPIAKDKFQSKLNNFLNISILSPGKFAEYTGFTIDEVKELCEIHNISFEECARWYDGYKVGKFHIFNPNAIVETITKEEFGSYWSQTSSYEAVSTYIDMNLDGVKDSIISMLSGIPVDLEIGSFCNSPNKIETKDDVFTYLLHLGYLAYDAENEQCYIPNKEIRKEWVYALRNNENYAPVVKFIEDSKRLIRETINGNAEAVADYFRSQQNR